MVLRLLATFSQQGLRRILRATRWLRSGGNQCSGCINAMKGYRSVWLCLKSLSPTVEWERGNTRITSTFCPVSSC